VDSGREYRAPYDALVLSPGASPVRPPLPGIFTLRSLPDSEDIRDWIDWKEPGRAVVVGGKFIHPLRDREIWMHSDAGQRAYYASRILTQHGFPVRNLSGGYHTFRACFPEDRMHTCRAEANVTSTCNC
jgi:hypothetical protein